MRVRLIIIVLAALLIGPPAPGAQARTAAALPCPAGVRLATLVRQADLILLGRPQVPSDALRRALDDPSPDYLDVPLDRASVLKGDSASPPYVVKVFPRDLPYTPPPQALLALSGKPSILFLTRVDEGSPGLYLSQSRDALQPQSPSTVAAVAAEVNRQQRLLREWKLNPTLPHYAEVRRLLAGLPAASRRRQADIFTALEKLGRSAVPALIAQMDDRRPLAYPQISLVNHAPDAFEGLRHYRPELIVDAIDAILNQIAGSGGSIVNGGSERERRSAVAEWRLYDSDRACRPS